MTETTTNLRPNHEEHILVCLSSSPSNAKIIQTAGRLAKAYHCKLTALYVETQEYKELDRIDIERLQTNIRLAKEQGAFLEQVIGEDIPYQISEFARLNGITQIVVGRSNVSGGYLIHRRSLTDKLISYLPDMQIYIIPDGDIEKNYRRKERKKLHRTFSIGDLLKTVVSLGIATGLSLMLYSLGFTDTNAITIYIFGVLVISVITNHMFYRVAASVASVIIFNYFFTEPRYTLWAYDIGYPMTFLVMLLASLLTGTLAGKLKRLAQQAAQQAYRTKVLLDTNQALQKADSKDGIWQTTRIQLEKLTDRKVDLYISDNMDIEMLLKEKAGSDEQCLAVRNGHTTYGAVGIHLTEGPMDVFENSIVLSILGECALSLENEKNLREKEQAAVLAENEQFRANLLRMISHDLRTPLTSISGNASNLLYNGIYFDEATKKQLYTDIYDDSMWLIGLVENLLSVTRLEGQGIRLQANVELLEEVVTDALQHLDRRKDLHTIKVVNEDEFLMVKVDAKLITQVMINLVNNAIKYTPSGSVITIHIFRKQNLAYVCVSDNGPGIPVEIQQKVFEMFYTGDRPVSDGHRSMGLGLALCKSIIEAHGGEIWAENSMEGGAQFTFTLPAEEVEIHE